MMKIQKCCKDFDIEMDESEIHCLACNRKMDICTDVGIENLINAWNNYQRVAPIKELVNCDVDCKLINLVFEKHSGKGKRKYTKSDVLNSPQRLHAKHKDLSL